MVQSSWFVVHGRKIKAFIFVLFFLVTCHLSLVTFSSPVSAADCTIPTVPPATPVPCEAAGIIQAQQLLTRIINISVTIAFMAVTVWLVWSALKLFITSGGDPKALAHAWSSVTWIFMGLFFMVLAWLVMKLIFAVTGADVTQYCLGFKPYCI